jgi:hypothetical protein
MKCHMACRNTVVIILRVKEKAKIAVCLSVHNTFVIILSYTAGLFVGNQNFVSKIRTGFCIQSLSHSSVVLVLHLFLIVSSVAVPFFVLICPVRRTYLTSRSSNITPFKHFKLLHVFIFPFLFFSQNICNT